MSGKKVNFRILERLVRGFSNHRRIQILLLLEREPELSVADIAEKLKINFKTVASHIRILTIAGLVMKKSHATQVFHKLTARAERVIAFLKTLE